VDVHTNTKTKDNVAVKVIAQSISSPTSQVDTYYFKLYNPMQQICQNDDCRNARVRNKTMLSWLSFCCLFLLQALVPVSLRPLFARPSTFMHVRVCMCAGVWVVVHVASDSVRVVMAGAQWMYAGTDDASKRCTDADVC
jgi:hypothetical protein